MEKELHVYAKELLGKGENQRSLAGIAGIIVAVRLSKGSGCRSLNYSAEYFFQDISRPCHRIGADIRFFFGHLVK